MKSVQLQAREGLNQEGARQNLPCQNRIDSGVEESGGMQWSSLPSPVPLVGHLMSMIGPGSKEKGDKSGRREE